MSAPDPLPKLMVAPNGARRGKADHPALPITIEETVATAITCQKAGAEGIHVHVRDSQGGHSLDVGLYREAIATLGAAVPGMFLQVTSEAVGLYSPSDQRGMIRELRPRSVTVALREMLSDPSEEDEAREFYSWAAAEGVVVQHIAYTPDELGWLLKCIDSGMIPGTSHQLQLALGSYAGTEPSRPADLDAFLSHLSPREGDMQFDWMLCAFGAAETACLAYAAKRGGKVRVGFENSLWNADGLLAKDNAERVREVLSAIAGDQTWSPADK